MATNGMTINGLNPLSALTADDKIPVWDTGASREPTKEITAQNFASSVKTLGSFLGTSDVVNDLTSGGTSVPLSAEMGKKLSGFVSNAFYSNTTKDAIISTLNSLYGNVYVVFAALHSMTDGTKTGAYCIIRNTSMWSAVRFIYLDGMHLITTDVTVGDITIGPSGYVNIKSYKPSGTIAFVQVLDYNQGTGALSVDAGGNYLSGTHGNVTGLKLRYFMSV